MGALVEHDFRKGFLLREEHLRKVHELIVSRLKPLGLPLQYRVRRADAFSYTTAHIDDILKEDNEDWQRIVWLELSAEDNEHLPDFTLSLRFRSANAAAGRGYFYERTPGVSIYIAGEDRDTVYLLFSDLREYLSNEVLSSRSWDKDTFRLGGMLLALLLMMASFVWALSGFTNAHPAELALASTDVNEKLNYIIQSRQFIEKKSALVFLLVAVILFPILVGTNAFYRTVKFMFPSNLFIFGKQLAVFERRRKLISNLIWIVGVGAIVSLATGLIVWKVTS